jgi:hypothetical protein
MLLPKVDASHFHIKKIKLAGTIGAYSDYRMIARPSQLLQLYVT